LALGEDSGGVKVNIDVGPILRLILQIFYI